MAEQEWVVDINDEPAVAELRAALFAADRTGRQPKGGVSDGTLEFLVDRFAGLRVEVFAREHPPPHFRVSCGQEAANYRIADCTQLNVGLRREHRTVRAWHAANKQKLIAAWNSRRPSDCPVGEYREA